MIAGQIAEGLHNTEIKVEAKLLWQMCQLVTLIENQRQPRQDSDLILK